MTIAAPLALLVLVAASASAQDPAVPPIDTDRPDFTDGTHTVPRSRWQLETGYTYQQGRGSDAGHSHSLPEALLRVGVTRRVELRIGENFLVQRADGSDISVRGLDDTYLGTKVSATAQQGAMPALSFELQARLPTGANAISGNAGHSVLPGAALLLGWETTGPWAAGAEAFITRTADQHGQAVGSLSVQFQAASRVQLYGEYFMLRPVGAGAGAAAEHYVNSGVLILLSNNTQVDARIGVGLNRAADKDFFGIGFAVRR